jgi:prevent-host-death family protein
MKSVTALEARKKFGGLLDEVAKKGTHIVISRVNRPLAVLIPYDEYQQTFDQATRQKRLQRVAERMDALRERHRDKLKGLDTAKIIREIRDSR